jgi:transposase
VNAFILEPDITVSLVQFYHSTLSTLSGQVQPAHKVAGVKELIEARGATLRYLPPYSPDLNPIELAFAKLKSLLRKAEARTISTLWDVIGKLLDLFPPEECANFFAHDGYGRSK